jgi:hypothetical protein
MSLVAETRYSSKTLSLLRYDIPTIQVCVYVFLCLLSFSLAYVGLNCLETRQMRQVRQSTLLYYSHDSTSRAMGEWAKTHFGIKTIDLAAPDAGSEVYHLTGMRSIDNPTLLLPQSDGQVGIISGYAAVNQSLEVATSSQAPFRLAERALLVMAVLIVVALLFRSEISAFAAFLPIAGIVAIAALWGRCLHCSFGGSLLSTLSPVLGLLYLSAGFVLYTFPLLRGRFYHWIFLIISALIPSVQAVLLVQEPKLCPSCLTITFVSVAYFVTAIQTLAANHLPSMSLPRWFSGAIAAALILLLVRHTLVLGGYVQAGKTGTIQTPQITGSSIQRFVPTLTTPQAGLVYVMGENTCPSCQAAERDLTHYGIAWRGIPFCSMVSSSFCFDAKDMQFPMPL